MTLFWLSFNCWWVIVVYGVVLWLALVWSSAIECYGGGSLRQRGVMGRWLPPPHSPKSTKYWYIIVSNTENQIQRTKLRPRYNLPSIGYNSIKHSAQNTKYQVASVKVQHQKYFSLSIRYWTSKLLPNKEHNNSTARSCLRYDMRLQNLYYRIENLYYSNDLWKCSNCSLIMLDCS